MAPEAPRTRIRHRSTRHTAALTLLALAFASACGDDGDEPSRKSGDQAEAAKADLVRRADAICKDAQEPIVVTGLRERNDALRPARQVLASNGLAADRIAELERLKPPAAIRGRWKAYLDAERALLEANRKFERSFSTGDDVTTARATKLAALRAAKAAAEEAAVDVDVAGKAVGLDTCAKVGVQAQFDVEKDQAKGIAGDGTFLPTVGVRATIPPGWGPKYFRERNAQAFDNDDGSVYCALRKDDFGDPPGDGSERALLDYAKEQAEFVKGRSRTYRLISIQPERAANGSGVSIRREVDGRVGRIAFFYLDDKRYVVDCNTDERRFEKADRDIFVPFMRGVTLPK